MSAAPTPTPPPGIVVVPMTSGTFAWLQISVWVVVILVIGIVAMFAYHLVDQFRTPLPSKRETEAHRQKKPTLLLAGDEGFVDVEFGRYVGNEGWFETKERGNPKVGYIGLLPTSTTSEVPIEVAAGASQKATQDLANYITFLNTRKVFLKGANNPVWIAVKPKAIVMNIKAFAAIQLTEEMQKLWNETVNSLANTPFPIDVHALKQMVIGRNYNTSLWKALAKVHEAIGEAKKPDNQISKWVLIAGFVMMGIGAAMLIATKV